MAVERIVELVSHKTIYHAVEVFIKKNCQQLLLPWKRKIKLLLPLFSICMKTFDYILD